MNCWCHKNTMKRSAFRFQASHIDHLRVPKPPKLPPLANTRHSAALHVTNRRLSECAARIFFFFFFQVSIRADDAAATAAVSLMPVGGVCGSPSPRVPLLFTSMSEYAHWGTRRLKCGSGFSFSLFKFTTGTSTVVFRRAEKLSLAPQYTQFLLDGSWFRQRNPWNPERRVHYNTVPAVQPKKLV